MLHYKVELGPVNFQNMGDIQMNKEVNKLDDIDTIDGNGQLYLALQDISMQNFTDELNKVKSLLFATQILRSVTVSASNSNSCVMVTKIIISGSRIVSEGSQQAVLSGDNG